MTRYDHAAELQATTPPLIKLDYLMADLRAWAARNPALRPLHAEFVVAVRQLHDASGTPDTDPAVLERAAAIIAATGTDGQEAAALLRLHAYGLREARGESS